MTRLLRDSGGAGLGSVGDNDTPPDYATTGGSPGARDATCVETGDNADMRVLLMLSCLTLGCGGGATPAATSPSSGDGTDCEPGRCLEDISNAIKPHRPKARACYDAALAKQPELPGNRILVNFRIGADGVIVDASQSVKDDQIEDAEVVACVIDVIKGVTFAPSAKGKTTRAYHVFEFGAARRRLAP